MENLSIGVDVLDMPALELDHALSNQRKPACQQHRRRHARAKRGVRRRNPHRALSSVTSKEGEQREYVKRCASVQIPYKAVAKITHIAHNTTHIAHNTSKKTLSARTHRHPRSTQHLLPHIIPHTHSVLADKRARDAHHGRFCMHRDLGLSASGAC